MTNKPTNYQVAKAYFGPETASRTTTLCASVAIRLARKTLSTKGSIFNSEHREICLQYEDIDSGRTQNVSEFLKTIECRVHRNMLEKH